MTALDLVTDLRRRGVALRTRDGRLQGSAPRGILTPEDRAALVAHKDEIIALLRREEEDTLIAEAVEISGARIIAEPPAGACPACHPHRDTAAKADTIFGDALGRWHDATAVRADRAARALSGVQRTRVARVRCLALRAVRAAGADPTDRRGAAAGGGARDCEPTRR